MTAPLLTLTTHRLLLRQFTDGDLDAYAAMCADPEVARWIGARAALSREDAWRQMALLRGHWELRGYGMWALEERASGAFAGRLGLHYPEGWLDRELGWALARPFWGRGYATEAGRAALRHAFDDLGWPRIVSFIDPANARSIRLAERLGERRDGATTVGGFRVDVYAMTRAQWHAA